MLPWEGCRDAGSREGDAGQSILLLPSQRRLSGSARCLPPPSTPSSPPSSSDTLGDASKPLSCLSAWSRSQFPWQGRSCPSSGSPCPGNSPRVPEGTAGHSHSNAHQDRDPLSPQHPASLSRVLQPHREQGQSSWRLLFPWDPLPKALFCFFIGKLYRLKKAKAALGSSDSRGVQPSFRGTKVEIKITQDNAEELFVPA